MKVLDVGAGPGGGTAQNVIEFEDAEIITLDAPGSGSDIEVDLTGDDFQALEGEYDHIWMSHVLEHLPLKYIQKTLKKLNDLLAPGGHIHIIVPSLEWACIQILSEDPSPITLWHIYGDQSDEYRFHRSGFTLEGLRDQMRAAGINVVRASRGVYQINMDRDGETLEFLAEQHYVLGMKPEPLKDEQGGDLTWG